MAGLEEHKDALAEQGARIVTASTDPLERAQEMAAKVSFPVGYGVTRAESDRVRAWWGDKRQNMQPAEFLLDAEGRVLHSLYASGPVGRMSAAELVRQLTNLNR